MSAKAVRLDLAAFCDSGTARALVAAPGGPSAAELRELAGAFLRAAYEELGVHPRLLDADTLAELVGELLPGHLTRRDPRAEHLPAALDAYLEHLTETAVVPHAFELRRALPELAERAAATVRAGANEPRRAGPEKPFVHGAPKLGRNDPCSCGSGKKYKKCHGKGR